MSNDDEIRSYHHRFAVETFNAAWDLIDKPDRTADEDALMLELAMASRFHWGLVGGPEQTNTGDWQIAHCASLIGQGELAMMFATRALATCYEQDWGDWRRASMLEGMARACAAAGDKAGRDQYAAEAEKAIALIAEADDRELIASQLATVPTL